MSKMHAAGADKGECITPSQGIYNVAQSKSMVKIFFLFKKKIAVRARQYAFFSHIGSALRLMEPLMQEGETQYWMPKVFMTLFLDFIMNKLALLLGGRILFSKMVHFSLMFLNTHRDDLCKD